MKICGKALEVSWCMKPSGGPLSTLSTLGKLPRGSIHHATSSAFPQIVPFFYQATNRSQALVPMYVRKVWKVREIRGTIKNNEIIIVKIRICLILQLCTLHFL